MFWFVVVGGVVILSVVVGHVDQDVHLLVREILVVLEQGTVGAAGLVDAVVDALVAHTLATTLVEPSTHREKGFLVINFTDNTLET